MSPSTHTLKVGLAQIRPAWLNRAATLEKVALYMKKAARENCELVVFGEALVPGYPFWLSHTDGAAFESPVQKAIHAKYLEESVCLEEGHLQSIQSLAKEYKLAVYLGIIERPLQQGGHSLYCSLVFIDLDGNIRSVHRKLRPTYEERLCWAPGDGHGLQVHALKSFRLGGLNCWENWMPLARAALYAMGENVHVAVWPGSASLTENITRFIARESRSFVISVSGLFQKTDIPDEVPHADLMRERFPALSADGGSCIAAPDGTWLLPPLTREESLMTAVLPIKKVWEERQNFDPSGHYARPDVLTLRIQARRQSPLDLLP